MRTVSLSIVVSTLFLLACGGCPPENYPTNIAVTLTEINEIRNDSTTTIQEKRAALVALGLDTLTIDSLLRTDPDGNQGGGDLRTAYDKIVAGDFQDLTPDEVQIYNNAAADADSTIEVSLTDAEALAVTQFFQDIGLNSADELEAYLNAGGPVPDDIPDGALTSIFVDFDPTLLLSDLP